MNEKKIREILVTGNLQEIKLQIKSSIEFKNGWNPLHYAAANKNKDVILYLIEDLKYDPTILPEDSITPLHRAAHYGNLEAIHLFLKYGIDPETKDEDGFNVIKTLNRNMHLDLTSLTEKMILASKNDFSSCLSLAQLYFSGEDPLLKKDLDNSIYYMKKGLSIKDITLEECLQGEDLLSKIKQTQLDNMQASLPSLEKEDKPKSTFSLSKSLTGLLKQVTISLLPHPHNNPPDSEKQSLLTKKNQ